MAPAKLSNPRLDRLIQIFSISAVIGMAVAIAANFFFARPR